MEPQSFIEKQEERLAGYIFSVSSAMVGVCLTVIGVINVISASKQFETLVDDFTAGDAVLFLAACILSYTSIKTKNRPVRLRLEKIADGFFLSAMTVMAGICLLIVRKVGWR